MLNSVSDIVNNTKSKYFKNSDENIQVTIQQEEENIEDQDVEEDDDSLFKNVPSFVILHVFSFLDVQQILSISSVSSRFNEISNDEFFWLARYETEKQSWTAYSGLTQTETGFIEKMKNLDSEKVSGYLKNSFDYLRKSQSNNIQSISNTTDEKKQIKSPAENLHKQRYLHEYKTNQKFGSLGIPKPETQTLNGLQTTLNKISQGSKIIKSKLNRVYKVPILGDGLESSAKKLLYSLMWGELTSLKITKLYPGTEGIGSGVGFNINGIEISLVALHRNTERGLFEDLRPKWKSFLETSDGIIFVFSPNDDLEHAKKELATCTLAEHSRKNAPLLILSCYSDVPDFNVSEREYTTEELKQFDSNFQTNIKYSPAHLAKLLDVDNLVVDRPYLIRNINCENFDGVSESFDWLSSKLSNTIF